MASDKRNGPHASTGQLGDEFGPESRDLTSDEFRTHIEALC